MMIWVFYSLLAFLLQPWNSLEHLAFGKLAMLVPLVFNDCKGGEKICGTACMTEACNFTPFSVA